MKCPKCHYLSFDPEPRCRNCGYTLTLDEDLSFKTTTPDGPLADLELKPPVRDVAEDRTGPPSARRPVAEPGSRRPRTSLPGPFDSDDFPSEADLPLRETRADGEAPRAKARSADAADSVTRPRPADAGASDEPSGAVERPSAPRIDAPRPRPAARVAPPTTELPLFVKGTTSDAPAPETAPVEPVAAPADNAVPEPPRPAPVVAPPVPPARPPRPVERAAPVVAPPVPARGPSPRLGPLDRDLLDGLQRIEAFEQQDAARQARTENTPGPLKRLLAASADGGLFAGLTAGLLWMTLRWCDLPWSAMRAIPVLPFGLFVVVIAVGYLVLFTTASGQTLGKMLAGIRVVDAGGAGTEEAPVTARQAIYRGLATVPSLLLFGAGFVPALFGDERAFHDRLAQTRVVRT